MLRILAVGLTLGEGIHNARAAAAFWTMPGSGNWEDATKWSTNPLVPDNGNGGVNYDVTIDTASPAYVTLGTEVTVDNFTFNSAGSSVSNQGRLEVLGTASLTKGTIVIPAGNGVSKGVIAGGTWNVGSDATLRLFGGRLENATINGDIHGWGVIAGSTTFSTAHLDGADSVLSFTSTSLPLADTVMFEGSEMGNRLVSLSSIGATGVIRTADNLSNGYYNDFYFERYMCYVRGSSLVNQGLISSQTAGQLVFIDGTSFTNQGVVQAINQGNLNIGGTWRNEGTIAVGAGSLVKLKGTFDATGGIGTFDNTAGGSILVTGTVLNTGNTLTLNNSTGSWTMSGGTIQGGAVNFADGKNLLFDENDHNFLNGVAVSGDGLLLGDRARVHFGGGTTFTEAHMSGSFSVLGFAPGESVAGTIWLEGAGAGARSVVMDGHDGTLTIGALGAIRTGADLKQGIGGYSYIYPDTSVRIGSTEPPPIGEDAEVPEWAGDPYGGKMTLINQGLISSETNRRSVYIDAVTINNSGVLQAVNGGILNVLSNGLTNTGTIEALNGGIVNIYRSFTGPGTWSNNGIIALDTSSSVMLGGTFDVTGGIGTFNNSAGGSLYITGTLLNTGHALTLNADTGSWYMGGGTIKGGSVNFADGQSLRFHDIPDNYPNYYSALDGVTVNGDIHIDDFSSALIKGGSTFNTAHLSGRDSVLAFAPGETLSSTVLFEGATDFRSVTMNGQSGTLTIAPTGVIRTASTLNNADRVNNIGSPGGEAFAYDFGGKMTLINQGLISSETSGQKITITASSLANSGTLQAVDGGILQITSPTFTNTGTLQALNGGTIAIGVGSVTATPGGGTINILANGKLALQDGQLSAPNITNRGEISGFGTIAVRPVNHGTIRSSGGALVFGNGIQGGSGTVQIDAGSSLDLSGGTSNSNGDYLIHNGNTPGSLNLGTHNFSVAVDYTNAGTGSGNSYNPRANVAGTGLILAEGDVSQRLTGAVTGGTTTTPQLDFGNIHTGTSKTLTYQIANAGTTGPSLRGAVQTAAGGAEISDSRLSGTGVTAGNFGPVVKGSNSGSRQVTFTGSTAGPLTGQSFGVVSNFDNIASQTVSVTGAVYRYASPSLTSGTSVNFGIVHVGDTVSQAVPVTNTAVNDGYSEGLNASFTTSSTGITTGGTLANLAPGSSSSALTIGLDTSSARIVAGTSTLSLVSDGAGSSGLGQTAIPDQILNLTGQVNNYAAPVFLKLSGGGTLVRNSANVFTLDFGTIGNSGMEEAPIITLGLLNDVSGPSDTLAGNFLTNTGIFTASGLDAFSGLTAGQTQGGLTLSLDNTESGIFTGSITFNAASQNASGYDGSLGAFVVNLQASVVPEPSGAALLMLAATGLFRRRIRLSV